MSGLEVQQPSWDHKAISMKTKVSMLKDGQDEKGKEKFDPAYNIIEPGTAHLKFSGNGRTKTPSHLKAL